MVGSRSEQGHSKGGPLAVLILLSSGSGLAPSSWFTGSPDVNTTLFNAYTIELYLRLAMLHPPLIMIIMSILKPHLELDAARSKPIGLARVTETPETHFPISFCTCLSRSALSPAFGALGADSIEWAAKPRR